MSAETKKPKGQPKKKEKPVELTNEQPRSNLVAQEPFRQPVLDDNYSWDALNLQFDRPFRSFAIAPIKTSDGTRWGVVEFHLDEELQCHKATGFFHLEMDQEFCEDGLKRIIRENLRIRF